MPHGFPAWLRITHYVNFFFIILLVRSGLQILMEHPRLYWNVHCTPNTEWLRLTPVEVPSDRVWTAKDDARHLSPWIGLPGYRHTVGFARHWHFLSVLFWVGNGLIFAVLLFGTGQWRRLVPTSWQIVPDAWAVFVHYATFHLPPEPNGFYRYNALQQLSYFAVVFVLAPLAILTGPSMSPALTNRFPWYPKLPGNRQIGRSLHFMVMCTFVIFIVGHVTMVALTGLVRNMNHIVLGTDDSRWLGVFLGLVGIGVVVAVNALANWTAWRHPRVAPACRSGDRHAGHGTPAQSRRPDRGVPPRGHLALSLAERQTSHQRGMEDAGGQWLQRTTDSRCPVWWRIRSSYHWMNSGPWGRQTQITLHHCIQGWSGIAEWGGLPMAELVKLVRPKPGGRVAVFYSFGEGTEREASTTTVTRSRTSCTHRPCWPTR